MGGTESRWVGGGACLSGAVGRTAAAVPQVRRSGPQLRTYMGEGSWGTQKEPAEDVLATVSCLLVVLIVVQTEAQRSECPNFICFSLTLLQFGDELHNTFKFFISQIPTGGISIF